jgi:hypothetical protein
LVAPMAVQWVVGREIAKVVAKVARRVQKLVGK